MNKDIRYKKWLENNFCLQEGKEPESLKQLYLDTINKRDQYIIDECLEDLALAELLNNNVVFLNNINVTKTEFTTCVYVICSDFFYLACADAESITISDYEPGSEIIELYQFFIKDPIWGGSKWVAKKRNLQPHPHVKKKMLEYGVWEDWLDNLTPRTKEEVRERQIDSILKNP
jgi:hypothetical protein